MDTSQQLGNGTEETKRKRKRVLETTMRTTLLLGQSHVAMHCLRPCKNCKKSKDCHARGPTAEAKTELN